jgi:DNA helicase-2/ATP-dependent DNA helicase PcrA
MTRAKERLFLSRAERRSTFGVGRSNPASRFLEELPDELIRQEVREIESEHFSPREPEWTDPVWRDEKESDFHDQGNSGRGMGEIILMPEGFMPLRIGMRVKHAKFGEGRVRSVEGMDENQKATIFFQAAGSKRLKVRYAHLEILE